ncbi:MAG: single-stranded-DNA-specific exonuclease RecJ, partial [bacterium]
SGADTILTCDNGISAGSSIRVAKELGMDVIVTDHHEVLEMPEDADVVIDAKQHGETYPYKELCGAGVAFKLIRALGGDPDFSLLPYVAFATIGDVVDLTGENRILVKEGLKALRKTDNLGLRALAEECRIEMEMIGTYHIGFILGPCLNASGRLDTAVKALQLLLAKEPLYAAHLAKELWELNAERKALTETGCKDAVENIERSERIDNVLVVYLPALHESLCGLVAGRMREKYNRPCFVLTRVEGGVKGSGRSIEAYSMFEKLCEVQDLLTKFGGHPMAAGLSMPEENVEAFRQALNEKAGLSEEDLRPKVVIDVPMPVSYITEELVEQLTLLEPFGKANPRPVFADRQVSLAHPRIFGASRNVLKTRVRSLSVPGDSREDLIGFQPAEVGPAFDAVAFRNVEALSKKIVEDHWGMIAYYPKFNEYMGRKRIELEILNFR